MSESTDNTHKTPKISPPELPPPQPTKTTTTEAPIPVGYVSVSGASKSVSNTRHNPLNVTEKPESKPKEVAKESQTHVQDAPKSKVSPQPPAPKQMASNPYLTQVQKNQRQFSEQQQQQTQFHPLRWPMDPEYQYQISNYLNPAAAATSASTLNSLGLNNMMAMQSAANVTPNALNVGLNPWIAAQTAAVGTPWSSLLAASGAFNPLLAATSGTNNVNMNPWLATLSGLSGGVGVQSNVNPSIGLSASATGKQCSLFVFHLPEDIDDHGLLQLFAPYGALSSNVMRHDTGRSRGFGFVQFNTRHEAQIAIDMMNGHQIGRKRLKVSFKREEPGHHKMRGAMIGSNAALNAVNASAAAAAAAATNAIQNNAMNHNDGKNEK